MTPRIAHIPQTIWPYHFPKILCLWVLLGLFVMVDSAHGQIISTVGGTGTAGYSGDGGAATLATMSRPHDLFVDTSGNIYFPELNNHVVRKIDTSGNISTVAGTGVAGFSGDGGLATSAQLHTPASIFFDQAGNMYIAERDNARIRKVDTSGTISTVAGTGSAGYSGDGSAATLAQLNKPTGVVVDVSGNIYIGDQSNHRIRKVDTSGNISTVAGTGTSGYSGDGGAATSAKFNSPGEVFVDDFGNLYISDRGNDRVRKVDTAGIISTVAGIGTHGFSGDGGPATSAQFKNPFSLYVDGAGNIFIPDRPNHRLRKVDTSGNISTIAGTGTGGGAGDGGLATLAELKEPVGVFADQSGNLFVAEYTGHRIRKITAQISQSTSSAGLSSASTVAAGSEVQILGLGVTGDGVDSVLSVGVTVSDLSSATGLASSDFGSLKLYRSSDATLDSGDQLIGSQSTVNIGVKTTITATTPNVPPNGSQVFYLVSATMSSSAVKGHAFKVGFAKNSLNTSLVGIGSGVTASDANKVTVSGLDETTTASGLSGAVIVVPGTEHQVFGIGMTGDGVANVNSVALTISDLSSATGLVSSDFTELRLYRSSNAMLDANDTRIGTQTNVSIGSATTITDTSTFVPANGTEVFYLVSVVLSSSAVGEHALKVGFAAGGVSATSGSVGTVVNADDANKVSVAKLTESTVATGLSGASVVLPGTESKIYGIGLTGDGVADVNSLTLTLSDLSTATGLASSDFTELRLYRSADTTLDSGDTRIGTQTTVNVGTSTTITDTSTFVLANGAATYYLVSAVLSSSAVSGHAFKVGFATGGVNTNTNGVGTAISANDTEKVTIAGLTESTVASGLSGASTVLLGSEQQVFGIGVTGDGVAGLNSVTLTVSDLSTATGLTSSDFTELRLYRSADATLDSGDTQIGSQSTVNVGSATTISATTTDVPSSGTTQFYLVSAVLSSSAVGGHAFKVGFASGGVSTNAGTGGTVVSADDAKKVTVAGLVESTVASGLPGVSTVLVGSEKQIYSVGLTGDGVAGVNGVTLTLSDLSNATGLASSDITQLKLYRSSDATLDSGDTEIGTQSTVNVGSATTVSVTSIDVPGSGETRFYLVSAVLSLSAVDGHAFKVGFASGGISTNAGTRGSMIAADDTKMVTVAGLSESTAAAGLSGASIILPGSEVQVFRYALAGNGVTGLNSVTLTLSDLSGATGLVSSDISELRLYRSSDATLDSGDTKIGTQATVNIGSATTISATTIDVPSSGTTQFYLVSAVLSSSAVGGHAFKVGFAAGGVNTNAGAGGSAVSASDANTVTIAGLTEAVNAVGLSGASTVLVGAERQVFGIGLKGDGVAGVNGVSLVLSDLSSATGLVASDISELRLYRSSDATLDNGDTQIGTQTTVNIGSTTTVSATSTDVPSSGATQYYLVSAVLNSSAVNGHAFKVDFVAGGVSTNAGNRGTAFEANDGNKVTIAGLAESTPATGLSSASTILPGDEVQVFHYAFSGNGVTGLNSVTLTLSDLSSATGLVASDISELRLYRSSDATLDSGDTEIGTQTTVNIGSTTTVSATSIDVPSAGTTRFYIVSAVLSSNAVGGHAFKVGFAAGGVNTNAGTGGAVVVADDAKKVTVAGLVESASAAGLPGASTVLVGTEKQVLGIGLQGDGVAGVNSVTLTISDLSNTTGLTSNDFTELRLYRSADATLDAGDTKIGFQATVNIGSATTISSSTTDIPGSGETRFYLVSAVLSANAGDGQAFKVGFSADGVNTNAGTRGTAVSDSDVNKVTIAGLSSSNAAAGLPGASIVLPGREVQVFRYALAGNGVTGLNNVTLTLSDLSSATGLVSSDISELRLYRSADAILDDGDTKIGTQTAVNIGSATTISAGSLDVPSLGTTQFYLVSAVLSSSAVSGHAFKVGFAAGGVNTNAGVGGSAVLADDSKKVTVAGLVEGAPAVGLPSALSVLPGSEVQVFHYPLKGDGVAGVNSVTITLSDIATTTGLAANDFVEMRLYRSADATLDSGDTQIGTQADVKIGSAITVSANSVDIPAFGATQFYIVSVVLNANAVGHHAFKVGFASGSVNTNAGPRGSPVAASEERKVSIIGITETTPAAGLSAADFFVPGNEAQIFSVGLTGNGVASLNGIALTLSDVSNATGIIASDIAELRLYRSADALLDSGDVKVGSQTTVNLGSVTTVPATTPDVVPALSEQFYLISAVLSPTAVGDHAFKVGFGAGGVQTALGGRGTDVIPSDDFAVRVLPPPALIKFKGLSSTEALPLLDWADVTGALSYVLEHADNAKFEDAKRITLSQSQYKFLEALTDGRYFWRVLAVTAKGPTLFSKPDDFQVASERADPQGVSIRVLAPVQNTIVAIGDTVRIEVQSYWTMSALDTVVVGLSSSTAVEDFGNIGLVDTMTVRTSRDGAIDRFVFPLVITAGLPETSSDGVVVQARVSVDGDSVPLKTLNNLSTLSIIADAGFDQTVGDGVRFGMDGQRPVNASFFTMAMIDTASLMNSGGDVFGTRATPAGAANNQQLVRSFKTGDEVTLRLKSDNVGGSGADRVRLHLVDAITPGYQTPDSALYSVDVSLYDLLTNNGDVRLSFTATEGQFQHAAVKNNMRVKVIGELIDRVGNAGANTAGAAVPQTFEQDVWVVADTQAPVAALDHPKQSGDRFTGRLDTTLVFRQDDGGFNPTSQFGLNPLAFSVDEGTTERWAVVGADSARYGGTHQTSALKVVTQDSFSVTDGQEIDLEIVARDSVGNVGREMVASVVFDWLAPTISDVFPAASLLPSSEINPLSVHPEFQVSEAIDSVSARYVQIGGSHTVTANADDLPLAKGKVEVTLADSLIDQARYTLQVFVRDLAGNVQISPLDTLVYTSEIRKPTADSFVVILDSALTVVDSVIVGVGLPLKITALNTVPAEGEEADAPVLYEKPGVLMHVDAPGQDVSGVTFDGVGVVNLGNGVAVLNGAGWLAGVHKVSVRSTKVLNDFSVIVEDTTWSETSVQVNFDGRLTGLAVDEGAFSAYSVMAMMSEQETQVVSGAFDIWVEPTDAFGNVSTKLLQGAVDLRADDSLTVSANLLDTRIPTSNRLGAVWVTFSSSIGDARLPQGPQKITGEGRLFSAVAPNRDGEGLVIGVHLANAKGDTVGTASGQSAPLDFVAVEVTGDSIVVVDPVAPANLIVQDYRGPDLKGDQGKHVMLAFGHTEKQSRIKTYRVYREILVASTLDESGRVVNLETPELKFVPWYEIEPPQGEVPQLVRAVVPALDNQESRWAVAGQWGNEFKTTSKVISESVRAVDDLPPEGVMEIQAQVSEDESEVTLNWQPSTDDRIVGTVHYRGYDTPIMGVEAYEIWRGTKVETLERIATLPAGSSGFNGAFVPGLVYRIDVLDLDNRTMGNPFAVDRAGPTVMVSTDTVRAGSTVEVVVSATRAKGLAGGSLTLKFDALALEVNEVTEGDLAAQMFVLARTDVPGEVTVTFAGAGGAEIDVGTLLNIQFLALSGALDGVHDLTLTDVLFRNGSGEVMVLSERVSGSLVVLSERVEMQMADVSADAGGSVVVPVTVDNAIGLAAGEWTLVYDAGVMQAIAVEAGDLATEASMLVLGQMDTPGQVKVILAGAQGLDQRNGELARVVFEVIEDAPDGFYGLDVTDIAFRNVAGDLMRVEAVQQRALAIPQGGPGVQIRVQDVFALAGEVDAVVGIEVMRATGLTAGEMTLVYDASVMDVTQVEAGELAQAVGMLVLGRVDEPGQMHITFAGAVGVARDFGALVRVRFDVKDQVLAGSYNMEVVSAEFRNALTEVMAQGTQLSGLMTVPDVNAGMGIWVVDAEASAGGRAEVGIRVERAVGLAGGDMVLTYDGGLLGLPDVIAGEAAIASNMLVLGQSDVVGELRIAFAGINDLVQAEGELAIVVFDVANEAPDDVYDVRLTSATFRDGAGNDVLVSERKNGKITVAASSDFNNDGVLNQSDLTLFEKHLGTQQSDADYDRRFDINRDGYINFQDFLTFVDEFTVARQKVSAAKPLGQVNQVVDEDKKQSAVSQ